MATDSTPATPVQPPVLPLHQRIAHFHGNHHEFLLWLIANPSRPQTEGMRKLGLAEETLYSWRRDIAGFKDVVDAVQEHRGDLRSDAAQALFNHAIIPLSEAMIERGKGSGRDAQRAAERILETVGVLPKSGEQLQQTPIVVTTHTYVLVQPAPGSTQGAIVESSAKELPAYAEAPAGKPPAN